MLQRGDRLATRQRVNWHAELEFLYIT
jgi:hypothetical protein